MATKKLLIALTTLVLLTGDVAAATKPCPPMPPYMRDKGAGARMFSLTLRFAPRFFGYLRHMGRIHPKANRDLGCLSKQLVNHGLGKKFYKNVGDTYYDGYKIRRAKLRWDP